MKRLVLAALVVGTSLPLLAVAAAAQYRPMTPAEGRYWPYSGQVPACDDESILTRIQSRFSQRERAYWKSGLAIQGFSDVRERGLRTNAVDTIPKRFCHAKAAFNDGRVRSVTYWIGENLGIIGWGAGVEWCVSGLDHHRAFAPDCRAAGP